MERVQVYVSNAIDEATRDNNRANQSTMGSIQDRARGREQTAQQ